MENLTIGQKIKKSLETVYLNEVSFDGSNLKATLTNTSNIDFWMREVEIAKKLQPQSKFWSDAFDFIKSKKK